MGFRVLVGARVLVGVRALVGALLATGFSLSTGCTLIHHDRYLGRTLEEARYVNRGFGLVLELGPLLSTWSVVETKPSTEAIDLDGNGTITVEERVVTTQPLLRLQTNTSTSGEIRVSVDIVSEPAASKANLEGLFRGELKKRSPATLEEAYRRAESLELALQRRALLTRMDEARWLALVDQPNVKAENAQVRRQVVRFELDSKDDALIGGFRQFVLTALAARETGRETRSERW